MKRTEEYCLQRLVFEVLLCSYSVCRSIRDGFGGKVGIAVLDGKSEEFGSIKECDNCEAVPRRINFRGQCILDLIGQQRSCFAKAMQAYTMKS